MTQLPPTIHELPADFSCSREKQLILCIVAHATQGSDSRDELQHGGGRGVSAHRLITRNGSQYRLVADDHGANHAGYSTWRNPRTGVVYSRTAEFSVNTISLSFELESLQRNDHDYTDEQLLSMGWLVYHWRRKYGTLPIVRHADIDPTRRSDPRGLTVDEIEQWTWKATQLVTHLPPAPAPGVVFYRVKAGVHATIREAPDNKSPVALDGNGRLAPGTVRGVLGRVRGLINGRAAWFYHLADHTGFVDVTALEKVVT